MRKTLATPLLFAAILFLIIRLSNDVPMKANYFMHSWRFIIIELAGVTGGSFLCYRLSWAWIRLCIESKIKAFIEYSVVMTIPAVMAVTVMALSHEVPLLTEIPDLVIPVIITVLMALWMYLTMKNHWLGKLYAHSLIREKEEKQARTEADLKLLRSQFHPHFLFNMLNTIYFAVDEENEKAREAIEHLSNLLRSQLYEGNGTVSLERETAALNSYIELCRIRFSDSLDMVSEVDIDDGKVEIHPHLLLPLVENAVKHSGGYPRWIKLKLRSDSEVIMLLVVNSISYQKATPEEESGLGLSNLRKRLELLYPEKYELTTESEEKIFKACLKLELR